MNYSIRNKHVDTFVAYILVPIVMFGTRSSLCTTTRIRREDLDRFWYSVIRSFCIERDYNATPYDYDIRFILPGMTIEGTSFSQRMMIFVTFIYALTLYQYYNAAVVSTLIRELPKNIKTLEDLLRSNLKAGAEDILYTKDYFKVSAYFLRRWVRVSTRTQCLLGAILERRQRAERKTQKT